MIQAPVVISCSAADTMELEGVNLAGWFGCRRLRAHGCRAGGRHGLPKAPMRGRAPKWLRCRFGQSAVRGTEKRPNFQPMASVDREATVRIEFRRKIQLRIAD